MLIKQLSKAAGVSIHTIRYYENLGLIKGETDEAVKTNNYKNYDENVVEKLEIIIDAKEAGFTLAEIRKLLEGFYGSSSSRAKQLEIFKTKIREIDEKIEQLKKVRKRFKRIKKDLETAEA